MIYYRPKTVDYHVIPVQMSALHVKYVQIHQRSTNVMYVSLVWTIKKTYTKTAKCKKPST